MLLEGMVQDLFRNITLQQMEALVRLIELRSFSKAAKSMNMTQPALTKNIRNLEDAVGFKVAERGYAGISLTREGRLIYDYARRILKLRDEAREKIINSRSQDTGNIYISASTIPATYILPAVLAGFRAKHPGIRAYVRTCDSEEAIESILEGRAEIGFIGKSPASGKLVSEPLWKDDMALIVPRGHRWFERKSVSLAELEPEPFIIRERGSGSRDTMERCLKDSLQTGISRLNVVSELGSSEALREAILCGLGVSILSTHAVRRELRQGLVRALELDNCRIERRFHLIYKKQFELMPCHKLFLGYAMESARDSQGREENRRTGG